MNTGKSDGNDLSEGVNVSLPSAEDIEISFSSNFDSQSSDLTFLINLPGWIIKGVLMNNG